VKDQAELIELIDGCIGHKRTAQEKFFKLYYGKMMGVCMRYISDRDSAQEVVQESFIKIFDKLASFDKKGSLEGWIRRIVVNTAIDSIRKSKKDPFRTDDDNDFKMGAVNPMEEQEDIDLFHLKAEIAMEAIQDLSPAYRAVFNLYVIENYSHKEIAEKLNISEGTSKSNLAKAKMNLMKLVTSKLDKQYSK
jgi:RNA polymerase sigma factor (sigma-70 family)